MVYCAQTEVELIADARQYRDARKPGCVTLRGGIARDDFLRKDLEFFQQHRRLDRIEAPGDADARGVVFIGALAVHAQASQPRRQFVVIGQDGAAVAVAAQRLGGEKARRRRERECAELAAPVSGAERLRRVVEHQKVVRGGDCGDRVVVGRQPEQVDRNDGARFEPEPPCGRDRALQARRVEIERLRLDVGHDRRGAAERDDFGGGAERERGTDHRVAGPDFPRHQHEKQRVGPARTGDRMARAAERRKLRFQRAHLRSVNELAVREYARDRIIDGAAEAAALRGDIDERDRPLVEAGMLIHHKIPV